MNRNQITLIKTTARKLRKQSTDAEKIFWEAVRNRKVKGRKFQRQYPIRFEFEDVERFFVADFCCFECKLVIEIDGSIHERQKDYDKLRTFIINHLGYKVLRFNNEEIENNIVGAVNQLEKLL